MKRKTTTIRRLDGRLRQALAAIGILLGTSLPSAAATPATSDIEALTSIRGAVVDYLVERHGTPNGDFNFEVGSVDPRLRLPRCADPLKVSDHSTGGVQQRVKVECIGPKPWALYVGVTLHRTEAVVVLTRPVARGAPLTPEVLRLEKRELTHALRQPFTDVTQLVEAAARRNLPAGHVVQATDIDVTRVVRRGQRVTLTTYAAGIEVTASGIAMADGGRGERIPVRNEKSDRVVYGQVSGDGRVEVRRPPVRTLSAGPASL